MVDLVVIYGLCAPIYVPNLELHRRLLAPTVLLAVQEVIEEPQLQITAVIRVKMRPMLDAVRFQPFLLGGSTHEAFEIAARVQALAAPIGCRQERRLNL